MAVLGCNLVLDLFLIPKFGLVGAALGSSLSLAGVNLLRLLEVHFVVGLNPYDRKSAKPLLAGLIATGLVWLLKSVWITGPGIWSLAVGLSAFGLFYLLGLFGLGLDDQDWLVLRSGARRLRTLRCYLSSFHAGSAKLPK